MDWDELFDSANEPSDSQVKKFIGTSFFDDLDNYLTQDCKVKSKLSYSDCAMDNGIWKGWNVKYKKSGKSLCTIYPKQGYFLALLPIGFREMGEAEVVIPTCSPYTRNLFNQSISGHHGKSLAFDVQNISIVNDMKKLISIRAGFSNAKQK